MQSYSLGDVSQCFQPLEERFQGLEWSEKDVGLLPPSIYWIPPTLDPGPGAEDTSSEDKLPALPLKAEGQFRKREAEAGWELRTTYSIWKDPDAGGKLKAGEGDDKEWDGWMASPTQWTWVWVGFGSWWWTGKPGVLQSMGSQRDTTERLNWTELYVEHP